MKTVLITLIKIYQMIISPIFHQLLGQKNICRHEISCSEFAKEAINKHGVLQGSKMAIKRLLSCQPFAQTYAN